MSALGEQVRFDLIDIIEDDPCTFQYGGKEYRGTCSGINSTHALEVGGFEDRPELSIAINLRDINGGLIFGQDRPAVGDRVTYREVAYRVDSTEIDPFEESLQLNLRSKNI